MDKRCVRACPNFEQKQQALEKARDRITAHEERQAAMDELSQRIGECGISTIFTGLKRDLQKQYDKQIEELRENVYSDAVAMGAVARIEGCLGPFARLATDEIICGTEVPGTRRLDPDA